MPLIQMLNKGELLKIFSEYDFRPLKRFGENYLIDGNIKDKIIAEACLSKDDIVLEIGPGLGALTIDIAESGAKIFAVEKDRKAFAILADIAGERFPGLDLVNSDILKFNPQSLRTRKKIKVVGNLPYYITTPILEYLIANKSRIISALVVIQKEVASRLLAGPGDDDYSSLSCFVRYHAEPEYIYTIKRTSFYPVPEVDSSLVRLKFLTSPPVDVSDEELLFRIIRGSFNQRRKTVINSLSRESVLDLAKEDLVKILRRAGVDPASRPENLSLSDFASIANAVKE
jgi:16S rRNA (adenine1518-N6/adenine1519-N6)-dimethyltransferase